MAHIMCTQKLWTALNHTTQPTIEVDHRLVRGTLLGDWAATVARFNRRDLVLAVNAQTYLTLVFPLTPRPRFRGNFANALGQALEDHRTITKDVAVRECAEIEVARFEHLSDRELRSTLDTVEFMCGIEMEYHEELRRVQWNLNQFPHANRDPCVPSEAVLALFATAANGVTSRGASARQPRGTRARPSQG
jgi:hypothetical protein